ncbi:MAG: hypothetical protein ABSG03_05660 [Bryobacteraceae bacterium]|jgi:hypothetical protein
MREWPALDSRQYIVAFQLRSTHDCPPDFELPPSVTSFDAALFLPRDDPDWFGRSSYPPRILLLNGSAMYVVSHPSAGEPPRRWELDQISSVESGHMLLKGWLRFIGSGFDLTVRYNTRGFPPVFRFMQRLRDRLLCDARGAGPWPATTPEPFRTQPPETASLDIKFTNALAGELDAAETVLMQVFQPPSQVRSGIWLLSRRRLIAGDLLALTDRRLLWITDRDRGSYSRFGSIASYAPFGAILSIGLTSDRGENMLRVELNSGSAWEVPMASESREASQRIAEDFAAALQVQKLQIQLQINKRRDGASRTEIRR